MLIGDTSCESSVILNKLEILQQVKDVDNFVSDELQSRNKEFKECVECE